MAYPSATPADVTFFGEHGYIVVEDAVDPADLEELVERCEQIIEKRDKLAFDWAWEKGKAKEEREFTILQSSPTMLWPDFLAKPPGKGAPTLWHQDEGYWGRNLDDGGITCWMPFHDVNEENGCMRFVDGGHRDGVLEHRQPENVQSDLLFCSPDESRAVSCPVRKGTVTFHHSKMPHMTTANRTDRWRRILTQHLRVSGLPGEGDHYPWKVYVNQFTGERVKPASR